MTKKWSRMARGSKAKTTGHCYVAAEAYFHLMGGKEAGMVAHVISMDGWTHWYVKDSRGDIHDVTREQFGGERPPYELGRPTGFLTSSPSKRAKILMGRCIS